MKKWTLESWIPKSVSISCRPIGLYLRENAATCYEHLSPIRCVNTILPSEVTKERLMNIY